MADKYNPNGCYSCGMVGGDSILSDDGDYLCMNCGSPTILSMVELLDVASQHFRYSSKIEVLDEIGELHEEYDFDD